MRRILLVDDKQDMVDKLAEALTLKGFDVTTTYNGQDALALLMAKGNFDVMVLDVRMPGISGEQVLEKITPGHPPVIVQTGDVYVDLSRFIGMKVVAVLYKPYDVDILVKAINRIDPKDPCSPTEPLTLDSDSA